MVLREAKNDFLRGMPVLMGWFVAALAAVGLSYGLYVRESAQLERFIRERETIRVGIFARLFGHDFHAVASNLLILVQNDGLRDFISNGSAPDLQRFGDEARRFAERQVGYDQVRYIDEHGMERLRFSYGEGFVPADALQDKSDRLFVREAARLSAGEIYLSVFDLNVERDRFDQPLKPTLRFATPVFDSAGRRRGMVVINYLGAQQFERFGELAPEFQHRLRVLNADGFWLHGPQRDQEWGFMLPERAEHTLARSAPELWRRIETELSGQARHDGGLFSWHRIAPVQLMSNAGIPGRSGDPWLVIASHIQAKDRTMAFAPLQQTFTFVGLALVGLVTVGSWLLHSRHRTAEKLRAVAELNTAIVQSANVAVISSDRHGTITGFNPTAERWLGWRADELVGKKTPAVFHVQEEVVNRAQQLSAELGRRIEPGFEALVAKVREGGLDQREWTYVRKDGERFPVWLAIARLHDRTGGIAGFVGVATDNTERHEAEQALREATLTAQESARLKSQFLANMSHEIRTPMNGVIGMIGLLLDTPLSEEQRSLANTVRTSADSLLTVINDILDFSKIEAGQLTFEALPFDVRDPVEACLGLVAERAHGKGLELAYLVADDVPHELIGDPARLQQVLLNLVGNAIKFTERGEVVVRVTMTRAHEHRVLLRFSVRDTGIGLTAEQQARLFQPFVQADGTTTRKYGGTGLGLAICKQLVTLMRGEIGIESEAGRGSTFWFTADFPMPETTEKITPRPINPSDVRALVVDDNATNREILVRQLAAWRVKADTAEDAAAALEILRAQKPESKSYAFALVDMQMPNMSGLELARAIHSDSALAGLKILILTSMGHNFSRSELDAAGVARVLVKPVRHSQLHDALVTLLGGPVNHAAAKSPARDQKLQFSNRGALHVLVAEDNLVNQHVARKQLEKFGIRPDIVNNGAEAVTAIQAKPYDVVLMDCQMPDVDGFEATRRVRAWEAARGEHSEPVTPLHIIALTANAMVGDREACLAAGMNDHVTKPVREADLVAALQRAVRG